MEQVNQNPLPTMPKPRTNRWKWVIICFAITALIVGGYEVGLFDYPIAIMMSGTDKIPLSVEKQYVSVRRQSFISLLAKCSKGNEIVFKVAGGGGFSGEDYYFDINGKEIGSDGVTDNPEPGAPGPLIDTSKYQCELFHSVK